MHTTEGGAHMSDQGLYRLFTIDPNGIKIELNYANDETCGLRPKLLASELPGTN